MKIAFTLCSNNYLAQAKILGDSLIKFNPEFNFIIGLIDRLSLDINYESNIGFEIIPVEDIGVSNFDELWKKYNIIELNTCIKPSYYKYIFNKYSDAEFVLFFDPDILIFNGLSDVENELETNDFVLVPHIFSPIPISDQRPNDNDFLNYGLYNLGFLGLRNTLQVINDFLPWWEERTLKLGYIRTWDGLFVDQLWFNLVPLFFKKICILNHIGYNVAPWNLQERALSFIGNDIIVNSKAKLVFYHFSSFKFSNPKVYFYNYSRNIGCNNIVLEHLYSMYYNLLIENGILMYSKIKCYFLKLKEENKLDESREKGSLKMRIKLLLSNLLPYFLLKLLKGSISK